MRWGRLRVERLRGGLGRGERKGEEVVWCQIVMGWRGALSMGMNDTKSSKGERLQWKWRVMILLSCCLGEK